MLSCKTLLYQSQGSYERYIQKDSAEGPVCFQLSSSDANELGTAVKKVTDLGADLIDLNCGCPVNKIRKRGAGSSLLMTPTKLFNLITAMKQNTHVPVSIKIRIDGKSNDAFNSEIVKVVEESGVDFLIVHGRHWTEHYETPCNYDQIQYFVDNLTIPVIGNGDIACVSSLKNMLATGCAGVMIGRAGVGQPWLIAKLIAEFQGQEFTPPSNQEVGNLFLEHVVDLIELLGNEKFAVLQARKLAKYYARSLTTKNEFCVQVNNCVSLMDLQTCVRNYFGFL
jgi:tRNA-dihydrouridine synthase B